MHRHLCCISALPDGARFDNLLQAQSAETAKASVGKPSFEVEPTTPAISKEAETESGKVQECSDGNTNAAFCTENLRAF
jgi:hypothetical protein